MIKKIISILLLAVILMGAVSVPFSVSASGGSTNYPLNSIVIKIEDIVTHQMLGGARFDIYFNNSAVSGGYGTLVATVDSDSSGVIIISGLPSGYYIVRQTMPANNYHLSINNEQHAYIKPDGTSIVELVFSNYRYGGLVVTLNNSDTGLPIQGAKFQVTDTNGAVVSNAADGIYTTGASGTFYLQNLPAGDYRVTQITAAQGYAMDSNPNVRTVRLQHTAADESMFTAAFTNSPLGSLTVRLRDSISKEPLSGAVFNVRLSGGADLGNFTTNASGSISLPGVARGTYIISQITAPSGYLLATETKTQYVNYVHTYAVDFENQPKSGLYITKYDADTKAPLRDAKFNVYRDSTLIGAYTTNGDGVIQINNLSPGWYTVVEIAAPSGYILDDTPKTVQVIAETLHRLDFDNRRLASLQIIKTDEFNGDPLGGAIFRVTAQSGEFVADVTTDASGIASIPALSPGWYVITETRAPIGYLITEPARVVEVKASVPTVVTITNRADNNLQILKLDYLTRNPLAGAHFRVEHANGELVGTYITDSTGKILVSSLREGAYVISEIMAPNGYQLDALPQTIVIGGGKLHTVEFLNKAHTSIEIVKIDSVTKLPLANARFKVTRPNGEEIGIYKTDSSGIALVTGLTEGTYIVAEIEAPDGYILHETPKTVVVTSGKITSVEFTNKPYSGIQIILTDSVTHNPLAGGRFTVERPNGERVGLHYTTDVSGTVIIPDLEPGVYIVKEVIAPNGYILDETAKNVIVVSEKLTIVEFQNDPYGSLVIRKMCELTEQPLAGARFTVRHQGTGNIVAENVTTGTDGSVSVPNLIPGWYVISETRAPQGYHLDTTATRTIEVKPHAPTTVTFANRPFSGIQIIKTDANTDAPLSGAVFTVQRSNGDKIGDKHTTDAAGQILIPELPEGVYIITEIQAPAEYILDALPQTVTVVSGRLAVARFTNTAFPYLHIVKTNASTGELVAGAEFMVTNNKGDLIANVVSQSTGAVSIKVEPGVYTVIETKAPDGFELNDPVQTVTVLADGSTTFSGVGGAVSSNTANFANRPLNSVEIVKLDSVTNNPLPGAVFSVKKSNGENIGSFRTDASGSILITGLTEGTYIIAELSAPDGYILDEIPQSINLSGGRLVSVMFFNKALSGIQIIKLDSVTGQPLSGASFRVTKANGEVIGNFRTETDGTAAVSNLEPGVYTVSEVSAPNGYQLDSTPKNVTVVSGRLATVEFTNKPHSGIQITKIDSVTNAPLANATFAVDRSNGERIGTYRTDASGTILISDLAGGAYIVREISAPNGYVLNETPKNVTVISGRLAAVEFSNDPYGSLVIRKTDDIDGRPLSGAHFTVRHQGGSVVGDYITDNSGSVTIPNLAPGWYVVSETKAPNGYHLDSAAKTIEVKSSVPTTITFTNKPFSGIEIIKVDANTKAPLSGATFIVERSNGERIGSYRTDAAGKIIVSDLADGTYIVSETVAPSGYQLDETPKTVVVASGKMTSVEFSNKPFSGIQILKTDAVTHAPLSSATFRVTRANGEVIGTYRTDAAGQILVHDLAEGIYIVAETIAPNGYTLDETPKNVTVVSGRLAVVEFTNRPHSGIQILKTDANTGNPLQGAVFTIQRVNGERVGGNYTTDVAGKIIVSDLPEGTYIISEIQAPAEYILDAKPQTVEVKSGRLTIAEFTNKPFPYLHIVKTNASTGELIAGAEFMITNSKGEIIANVVSQSSGAVSIKVAPGVYTVTETKAPAGFELNNPVQTVEVRADGSMSFSGVGGAVSSNTANFANRPLNALEITKLDEITKNPLSGAVFTIDKSNGERIGSFRTDASGMILLTGLTEGTYIIKEISAPDGYILSEIPRNVTLSGGRLINEIFFNKPLSGIQILKLDAVTGQPLSGASFNVTRANGTSIGTFRTDADGMVIVPNLDEGSYIVSEINAPNGYQLDSTPKTINVVSGRIAAVEFTNKPHSGIQILKTDAVTHAPLANATFSVDRSNGERIGIYRTDAAGQILVNDLPVGTYIVSEIAAPNGYQLNETPKTVNVASGKLAAVEFTNAPYGSLVIKKTDEITSRPLAGAHFTVKHQNGASVGDFVTDNDGSIIIPNLEPGWYVISETKAPNNYHLDSAAKTIEVRSHAPTTVTFTNKPYSGIQIIKTNAVTNAPLSGATFRVTRANGEVIGTYRTDSAGMIIISDLSEGMYVVSETIAPNGFMLDETPKNVNVVSGRMATVEFTNKPHSGIEILKLDAITLRPLMGATFEITRDNGEKIGTYRTDWTGKIIVNNLPEGTYIVSEIMAPSGYQIDEAPKTIIVKSGKLTVVEFTNKPLSGIEIIKIDASTKAPLMGATFEITRANGEKVGTYKTDASGKIIIGNLAEGTYIVSEMVAPDGYQLDETPKTVVVTSGKLASVEFTNKPHSGIVIYKFDTETKAPLTGATFLVEKVNGERVGTYKTDRTGKIIVNDLPEGTYIVSETIAPDGYILDEAPKTIIVKSGKITEVEFFNKPLAGLRIIKLDSVTRNPIEGVEFSINKMNGERVENEFRGYTFKTDRTGQIYIPQLENGYYIVTETRTVDGYILDGEPKTVLVQSGKTTVLEVLNTPMSGLLIVKTDSVTGRPITGAVFDIRRADGSLVSGNILDGNQPNTANNSQNQTTSGNGNVTGSYTTDANGRILINGLAAGQYTATERKAPDGYELDTTVYNVTVVPGKLATLQLQNTPLGGIRLTKIDSLTKKPIFGVEFMLFDMSGKVIGVFYTDNNGRIDFPTNIPAGRYTIRETRAAAGYYLDEIPKTIEFVPGKITEIKWENTPMMGQIQIIKRSGDDNEVNGLPKGTLLEGAVFEVYNQRTGNLIDRFVTGKDGRGVSSPLPLGRYIVKEVQAPKNYMLSDKELDITLEFATQIVRNEFLNYSANTGVSIKKTGNAEAMPGDTIRYDIREIRNTSTVPLTDFYWRDVLPVDAVRLNRIVTGTYNQSLRYKVMATTNKGNTITIADNLSTTKNNVINCAPSALGLKSDEFVTSFTLMFGTVKAGFASVEQPQVFVDVLKTLPNGYRFSNKVDVGGKYNGEWIVGTSTITTTIYSNSKLPKTGY